MAQHFVEAIKRAEKPARRHLRQVILFGSYARGEAHAESDVDLLVLVDIVDRAIFHQISAWSTWAMAQTGYEQLLVAMPKAENEWKRQCRLRTPFSQEVQQDGMALWKRS